MGNELLELARECIKTLPANPIGMLNNETTNETTDPNKPPAACVDYATIGRDVNTFIGYSVFALHKHYTHEQKFNEFQVVADKYWILTDMRVKEEDIINDQDYITKYYDSYYAILNRGGLTLIAPRYIQLFHGILFHISQYVNQTKMVEERDEFLKLARSQVMKQVPHWSLKLEAITNGLPLLNSQTATKEVMRELVTKIFNSRGNSIIKRYYSTYLARGGKTASQSSSRELRKQEGLGKKEIKKES